MNEDKIDDEHKYLFEPLQDLTPYELCRIAPWRWGDERRGHLIPKGCERHFERVREAYEKW